VRGGDGGDDRQTEADAVHRAGAIDDKAPERLSELFNARSVEPRTAIFDDQPCDLAADLIGDRDEATSRVVADRVLDQVIDHPGQQRRAPGYDDWRGRRAQLVRGVRDKPPLGLERRLEAAEKPVDRVR
jgi:hypothetical protein